MKKTEREKGTMHLDRGEGVCRIKTEREGDYAFISAVMVQHVDNMAALYLTLACKQKNL